MRFELSESSAPTIYQYSTVENVGGPLGAWEIYTRTRAGIVLLISSKYSFWMLHELLEGSVDLRFNVCPWVSVAQLISLLIRCRSYQRRTND